MHSMEPGSPRECRTVAGHPTPPCRTRRADSSRRGLRGATRGRGDRVGNDRIAAQNEPILLRVRAMTTVADILKSKSIQTVHTIAADATVLDAVQRMFEVNTGALVVLENGRVIGMVSERDCARKVILEELSAREARVGQIMSTRVLIV